MDNFFVAVRAYVDAVFAHCSGAGLLADSVKVQTRRPPVWEGRVLSNWACQHNFLRTLDALEALGDTASGDRAQTWAGAAWEKLRDPASGLLYWGGHTSYDLAGDAPVVGNHELKCVYPHYAYLYRSDPAATRRLVTAFWHAHIWDWQTLLFNRHGAYESWEESWRVDFAGGPLPIVENTALSFINTGSDLIVAGALLHALGGDDEPLRWAGHLLSRYDEIRHPETGLAGYQFNHRDPCRVRASFKPPWNGRDDLNETTVITNGVIQTRYGRAAVAFLNLAEALGDEKGRPFLHLVLDDLRALARYGYDVEARCFRAVLNDGSRLLPAYAEDGVGYCPPQKLNAVPANGLMFLSYARAYRLSADEVMGRMAHALAEGMGWGDLDDPVDFSGDTSPGSEEPWVNRGQNDVCALFGLLDLYATTRQEAQLQSALSLGQRLLQQYRVGDWIVSGAPDESSNIDTALPLALLHLEAARAGEKAPLPTFYPNNTYFDPKIVVRNWEKG